MKKKYITPSTEMIITKIESLMVTDSEGNNEDPLAKRHDFSFGDDDIWSDDLWSDDNTTSTSTANSWGYDAFWGAGK